MIDREKTIRDLETIGAWHTHHYEPFHYECEVAFCHITCPVCGISLWANTISPVAYESPEVSEDAAD